MWRVNGSTSRQSSEPPLQQRLLVRAHSRSAVAVALTTPWGALWTGGSSGSLRWWPTAMPEAARAPHTTALDFRTLPCCELRRATGERAHASVTSLQLTSGGQVRDTLPLHTQLHASTLTWGTGNRGWQGCSQHILTIAVGSALPHQSNLS